MLFLFALYYKILLSATKVSVGNTPRGLTNEWTW